MSHAEIAETAEMIEEDITLIRNEFLTAETLRAQRSIFCLAGRYRQTKRFLSFQYKLIIGAIAIEWVRSYSRRDGVSDPIVPPKAGLDQNKICPQRPPRLSGGPDFETST